MGKIVGEENSENVITQEEIDEALETIYDLFTKFPNNKKAVPLERPLLISFQNLINKNFIGKN